MKIVKTINIYTIKNRIKVPKISMNTKLLLYLFTSGFAIFIINSSLFPLPKKINNNVSTYWFQQAYFRNELYLYMDKMRDKKLLLKLQNHSKNLKNNNINTVEYLSVYQEYMYEITQLSRILLELKNNARFIIEDILYLADNVDNNNSKYKTLIEDTRKNAEQITLTSYLIKSKNEKIVDFSSKITKQINEFYNLMNTIQKENNDANKTINMIIAEKQLLQSIGKAKYDNIIGLKEPDIFFKLLRTFGKEVSKLNDNYEKLLSIYKKESLNKELWNSSVNYFAYFVFLSLLLFNFKREIVKQDIK